MWFCTLWNMFFWGSEKWTDPMLNHTAGGVSIGKAIHNNRGIQQMARQMDPVLGDTTRCCPCLLIYNHYELVWYTINPTVFAVFTCSPGRSPGKNKFCVCPRATSRVTWFVLFWHAKSGFLIGKSVNSMGHGFYSSGLFLSRHHKMHVQPQPRGLVSVLGMLSTWKSGDWRIDLHVAHWIDHLVMRSTHF